MKTAGGWGESVFTSEPCNNVATTWPYSKDEMPYVEDFHEIFMMIIESCG